MTKITDINENTPHISGPVICMNCGHKWIGVAPVGTNWLECEECGTFKGVFQGAASREDVLIWKCNCENTLFEIHPDGIFCPNCGILQVFPDFEE